MLDKIRIEKIIHQGAKMLKICLKGLVVRVKKVKLMSIFGYERSSRNLAFPIHAEI